MTTHQEPLTPGLSPRKAGARGKSLHRLLVLLLLTGLLSVESVFAGVDLSQSQVSSESKSVPAGSTVTVTVVLKNSGDTVSEVTDLRIRFPRNGFFVRIDELPELKRDDDEREVTARVNIPAGEEFRFSFELLAPRDAAGKTLSADIEIRNFFADARLDTEFSTQITSEPTTAGVVIGGLRFHPAAFWLLGWLAFGGLLFVWIRARLTWVNEHPKSAALASEVRRMPPFGVVALVMIPMAFLLVFGGMAWRDLQTLTSWKEAQATILDRRDVVKTESRSEPGKPRRTSTTHTPEFALKYQAGDREVISSGFETGSSLHIGGQVMGKANMDNWVPGRTIPCWYDPEIPTHVVVRRGFGVAYIFALFPLPILWFGVRQLRKLSTAVKRLDESDSQPA